MKLAKKDFFSIIVYTSVASGMYYLSGFYGVLSIALNIIIYTIVACLIYITIKYVFKKKIKLNQFISKFLFSLSIIITILFSVIGSFSYYYNENSPALMPEYTLTNGEKTLVFQSMMHIGGKSFYNQVAENLKKYKKEGFVHFFEGVKPGSIENIEAFNKALGINFNENTYVNMSKIYGLVHQDYKNIIGELSDKDINVDISIDDIMEKYKGKNVEKTKETENPIDISKEISKLTDNLNSRELKLLIYINRAVMNFMMSDKKALEHLVGFQNEELFDIILNERNKILVDEIMNSDYKKIYVTYGLLHFDGVLEILKEKDPNWKIEKVVNYKALD